jgi:plasmid stabilization system protein ParE
VKLFFTPGAERQATEMDAWLREHRPGARDLFARELAEARELIAGTPTAGTKYMAVSGMPFRRVFMPRTKNHIYFEVDEAQGVVIVHALWGAPRGRGPKL